MTSQQALLLRVHVTRVVRRATRYRGMLVLVLWQVPIQPVVHPNGSLGIMIGAGSDEHAELNCDGDLVRSDRVNHRVAAVEADYNVSPKVRVDAAAGLMMSDWGSHDGAFGTVVIRGDWNRIGVGAGMSLSPDFAEYESGGTTAWPSAYLRAGSATGVHLRADVFPPTAFAAQQIARLGVGYNAVQRDQGSGFIGVAGVGSNEGATGVVGELTLPMSGRVALRFEGYYGSGQEHSVNGFALGLRYLTGGEPPAASADRSPAAVERNLQDD